MFTGWNIHILSWLCSDFRSSKPWQTYSKQLTVLSYLIYIQIIDNSVFFWFSFFIMTAYRFLAFLFRFTGKQCTLLYYNSIWLINRQTKFSKSTFNSLVMMIRKSIVRINYKVTVILIKKKKQKKSGLNPISDWGLIKNIFPWQLKYAINFDL